MRVEQNVVIGGVVVVLSLNLHAQDEASAAAELRGLAPMITLAPMMAEAKSGVPS